MKALWKGTISFGLVSIPVQLFSAIQEHVLGFTVLCSECHFPLEYQRWCSKCKKKIAWTDVVKGLEVKKGQYIILTQEKIRQLKPEATNTIDISEFVSIHEIAPIYYDHHYYLMPTEPAKAKAFTLFAQALQELDKAAVGKFIMHDKEHVCALQSYENGILLSTLNYDYEIRAFKNNEISKKNSQKVSASELKLAKALITRLSKKKFDIAKFKDTFAEQLIKLLKQKKHDKKTALPCTKKKVKRVVKKPSLEDLLQESLHEARA